MKFPLKIIASQTAFGSLAAAGNPKHIFDAHYWSANSHAAKQNAEMFSAAVSSLKYGGVFRRTRPGRHASLDAFLNQEFRLRQNLTFIDCGASDCSTTLELVSLLDRRISNVIPIDLFFTIDFGVNENGSPILARFVSGEPAILLGKRWLAYAPSEWPPGLIWLSKWLWALTLSKVVEYRRVSLINPEVRQKLELNWKCTFLEANFCNSFQWPPADIVRFANVLIPEYFSADTMRRVLYEACKSLNNDGMVVISHNRRKSYDATILRKNERKLECIRSIGNGTIAGKIAESLEL